MKLIDGISVFFPAYNEEGNIEKTINNAVRVLDKNANNYEIIVVDDGSKDKTSEIVEKLAKRNDKIRLIKHEKNKGYGAAVSTGLYNSKFPWVVFTDSDGQFDFSELSNFVKAQKENGADLVIGYYAKRKVPFYRILNSKIWESIVYLLFGLKVKDIDCGFKLIKKEVIDSIPKLEAQRGAFISTEFLVKSKMNGFKIVEIPATHFERTEGQATGASMKVIINSLKDLFKLRKKIGSLRN